MRLLCQSRRLEERFPRVERQTGLLARLSSASTM